MEFNVLLTKKKTHTILIQRDEATGTYRDLLPSCDLHLRFCDAIFILVVAFTLIIKHPHMFERFNLYFLLEYLRI